MTYSILPKELFAKEEVTPVIGARDEKDLIKIYFNQDNGEWQRVRSVLSLILDSENIDDTHAFIRVPMSEISKFTDSKLFDDLESFLTNNSLEIDGVRLFSPIIHRYEIANHHMIMAGKGKFFAKLMTYYLGDFSVSYKTFFNENNLPLRTVLKFNTPSSNTIPLQRYHLEDTLNLLIGESTKKQSLDYSFANYHFEFSDSALIIDYSMPYNIGREFLSDIFYFPFNEIVICNNTLKDTVYPFTKLSTKDLATTKDLSQFIANKNYLPSIVIPYTQHTEMVYSISEYKGESYLNIVIYSQVNNFSEILHKLDNGSYTLPSMKDVEAFTYIEHIKALDTYAFYLIKKL